MFYYTHHNDTDVRRYVYVYVPSFYVWCWMFFAHITTKRTLSSRYTLMYLRPTFVTGSFTAFIRAIWTPSIMYSWRTFIINLVLNVILHSLQRYERPPVRISWCTFIYVLYCYHYNGMGALQYVNVDVTTMYFGQWKFYCAHHGNMGPTQ